MQLHREQMKEMRNILTQNYQNCQFKTIKLNEQIIRKIYVTGSNKT